MPLVPWDEPAYWPGRWEVVYPKRWFDPIRTEFVHWHLGWDLKSDIEWHYLGGPLHYLMWVAAKTDHSRIAIGLRFLYDHCLYSSNEEGYIWKRIDLGNLMRQVPEWTMVIDDPVIVKTDIQTAAMSGLFGLLVDSRVQIVDVDDKALMNRFLALGDVPGVTFSDTSFEEAALEDCGYLPKDVRHIFESEDNAPRFKVAVMFRLQVE